MGVFSGTKTSKPEKYIENLRLEGEKVECTFKLHRHFISLTNKRVILVKKTLLARDVSIRSIPYPRIDSIVIEKNRKLFSLSSIIKIINNNREYKFKVGKGEGEMELYNTLVRLVCEYGENNKKTKMEEPKN